MYLFAQIILVTILVTLSVPTWCGEIAIYASPEGNDARRGEGENNAVATIQRAMSLAEAVPAGTTQVNVILSPGIYLAQRFATSGNRHGVPILVVSGSGGRAVFDGNGQGGTWMTLYPRDGKPSNLKLNEIDVRNYETAVNAKGDRNNSEDWAGGMEIRRCSFTNIGNIAKSGASPSTAAIRLVNSDRNVIAYNVFTHIRNNESCVLLHAIYVAHESTDNLIEGNYFEDSCGDAIRFRDGSSRNIVRSNTFKNSWYLSPVSDWFCDQDRRSDCTKASGECPSYDNVLDSNKIVSSSEPPPPIFIPWGEPPARCEAGQRATVR